MKKEFSKWLVRNSSWIGTVIATVLSAIFLNVFAAFAVGFLAIVLLGMEIVLRETTAERQTPKLVGKTETFKNQSLGKIRNLFANVHAQRVNRLLSFALLVVVAVVLANLVANDMDGERDAGLLQEENVELQEDNVELQEESVRLLESRFRFVESKIDEFVASTLSTSRSVGVPLTLLPSSCRQELLAIDTELDGLSLESHHGIGLKESLKAALNVYLGQPNHEQLKPIKATANMLALAEDFQSSVAIYEELVSSAREDKASIKLKLVYLHNRLGNKSKAEDWIQKISDSKNVEKLSAIQEIIFDDLVINSGDMEYEERISKLERLKEKASKAYDDFQEIKFLRAGARLSDRIAYWHAIEYRRIMLKQKPGKPEVLDEIHSKRAWNAKLSVEKWQKIYSQTKSARDRIDWATAIRVQASAAVDASDLELADSLFREAKIQFSELGLKVGSSDFIARQKLMIENWLGDMMAKKENWSAALVHYKEASAITSALSKKMPSNNQLKHDLAVCEYKLGCGVANLAESKLNKSNLRSSYKTSFRHFSTMEYLLTTIIESDSIPHPLTLKRLTAEQQVSRQMKNKCKEEISKIAEPPVDVSLPNPKDQVVELRDSLVPEE